MKKKSINKRTFMFFVVLCLSGMYVTTKATQAIESSEYSISAGTFNETSTVSESSEYRLRQTIGNNSGTNTKSGEYAILTNLSTSEKAVGITVANISVDMGVLKQNSFAHETVALELITSTSKSPQVYALQHRPLSTLASDIAINNTRCGSAQNERCTKDKSGRWNNPHDSGFGYSIKGSGSETDFSNGTNFRPFPSSPFEPAIRIISPTNQRIHTESLLLKAALPESYTSGTYNAVVELLALPEF